jgi:ferric-dicitrate binding protein FerR (iron transport regulator)
MTDERDDKIADFLWDPASPADPGVEAIEARLLPLRFEPAARPLVLPRPARPVGGTHRVRWALAAAALLVAASAGWAQWRFTWPAGRGWEISTPVSSRLSRLEVGATLELPAADPAVAPTVINVARIGTMTVAGGSRVTLQSTQGTRHRLQMDAGEAHFRVWAPPRSVAIQTPVGEVIDFGCEFDLRVDQDMTRIDVRSGWVQLDNTVGEVLRPWN